MRGNECKATARIFIDSTAQFRHLASRMRALDVQLVATFKQAG
jgi:hypothetical protein